MRITVQGRQEAAACMKIREQLFKDRYATAASLLPKPQVNAQSSLYWVTSRGCHWEAPYAFGPGLSAVPGLSISLPWLTQKRRGSLPAGWAMTRPMPSQEQLQDKCQVFQNPEGWECLVWAIPGLTSA